MKHSSYLIDGVAVPKKIWQRRQLFGEYTGARFTVVERGERYEHSPDERSSSKR